MSGGGGSAPTPRAAPRLEPTPRERFPLLAPRATFPRVSQPADPPFLTRLVFAFACFFRVLFDPAFAGRALAVRDGMPSLPPPKEPGKEKEPAKVVAPPPPKDDSALTLLALFQREGRLVDFLEEDVQSFPDADIGAAARVVHAGCRKALREHVTLEPVRAEEEGAKVTLERGFDASVTKLVGNVTGDGPYAGALKHRGWRVVEARLPRPLEGHDARVIAQAEVEL